MNKRAGYGKCFGTFGELLQGILPCDEKFLVTFPINNYSYSTFEYSEEDTELEVFPAYKNKAKDAAIKLLSKNNKKVTGRLKIYSELKEGKGFSGSSADLVSVMRAIDDYYDLNVCISEKEEILSTIEPTDGVMYNDSVSYYHCKVKLDQKLGMLPDISIIAIDDGDMVDSILFNRIDIANIYSHNEKEYYQALKSDLSKAIKNKDTKNIGLISTESVKLNQKVNPKKSFEFMLNMLHKSKAIGLATCHSGTCIGIMFDKMDPLYNKKIDFLKKNLVTKGYSFETYNSLTSQAPTYF